MRMAGTGRSYPDSAARRYSRCRAARKGQPPRLRAIRPAILSVLQRRPAGTRPTIALLPVTAAAMTTVAGAWTQAASTIHIRIARATGIAAGKPEPPATTIRRPAVTGAAAAPISAGIKVTTVIRSPLALGTTTTISGIRVRTMDYRAPDNGMPVASVGATA